MNNIGIINDYKSQNHMQELKASLKNYSTSSIFEDDTWVLDKLKKSEGHTMNKYTLWFSPITKECRDITKYFALIRLGNNISVSTVGSNIYGLKVFYNFLYEVYGKIPLNKLNKSIIMDFEDYLRKESFKKSTKEIIWSSINIFFLQ